LLADERVDPSAGDQYSIRWASTHGHLEVVKLLLADERVDPSAPDQCSVRFASENGHCEVVEWLLADVRVDPSADNQYSIRAATKNGHSEVVKVLLADQRVVVPLSSMMPISDPVCLSLFLLRRSFRLDFLQGEFNTDLSIQLADVTKIESQRRALLEPYLLDDLVAICLTYVPDLFCHVGRLASLIQFPNALPRFTFGSLSTL
jgi:hypothetical protein